MKYMNAKKYYLNLQLFADGGDDGDNAGGDDQDPDEDEDGDDQDDQEGKKFSQADMDEAVKKRLAREKRKWQREQEKKKPDDSSTEKDEDKDEDPELKTKLENAGRLEVKVACYEAGVAKDAVDDVTALARAYMAADEDLDLEDAIEKVVKKYPQFKNGSADPYEDEEDTKKKSWGERQKGRSASKLSGVEQSFYELNPDLRK